jgi:hypothetical protein
VSEEGVWSQQAFLNISPYDSRDKEEGNQGSGGAVAAEVEISADNSMVTVGGIGKWIGQYSPSDLYCQHSLSPSHSNIRPTCSTGSQFTFKKYGSIWIKESESKNIDRNVGLLVCGTRILHAGMPFLKCWKHR